MHASSHFKLKLIEIQSFQIDVSDGVSIFGSVHTKYYLYIGINLQRNVWVHIKSEMEAFI